MIAAVIAIVLVVVAHPMSRVYFVVLSRFLGGQELADSTGDTHDGAFVNYCW